jgi:hypothetical protein
MKSLINAIPIYIESLAGKLTQNRTGDCLMHQLMLHSNPDYDVYLFVKQVDISFQWKACRLDYKRYVLHAPNNKTVDIEIQ